MSDGHVCDWARTLGGTIRCAICGEPMSQTEELRRLNATERLSVKNARYFAKETRMLALQKYLSDYADIREGK